ncbi:hypothetical protein [Clostridium butyricum]|uniref:hypothetical protein n=1 Tax=Clostridium butyricum TaxID=1492 RepID=UPI00168A4B66|nr:hypothetical protein [Clostridium butyricum]MDB2152485.1 hypothetical protein [Clostridium butyricum]
MSEYIKTSISREKLYERNYTRDTVTKVIEENEETHKDTSYRALIEILTMKYCEKLNG